jgi:hypothetical protein
MTTLIREESHFPRPLNNQESHIRRPVRGALFGVPLDKYEENDKTL